MRTNTAATARAARPAFTAKPGRAKTDDRQCHDNDHIGSQFRSDGRGIYNIPASGCGSSVAEQRIAKPAPIVSPAVGKWHPLPNGTWLRPAAAGGSRHIAWKQ